jgi:hypothetical protein
VVYPSPYPHLDFPQLKWRQFWDIILGQNHASILRTTYTSYTWDLCVAWCPYKRRCIKFVEGIQVVVYRATENHWILGRGISREPGPWQSTALHMLKNMYTCNMYIIYIYNILLIMYSISIHTLTQCGSGCWRTEAASPVTQESQDPLTMQLKTPAWWCP